MNAAQKWRHHNIHTATELAAAEKNDSKSEKLFLLKCRREADGVRERQRLQRAEWGWSHRAGTARFLASCHGARLVFPAATSGIAAARRGSSDGVSSRFPSRVRSEHLTTGGAASKNSIFPSRTFHPLLATAPTSAVFKIEKLKHSIC